MSQEKEVTELTVDFELIVPDMEFNSCWHLANWLVNSSTYIKKQASLNIITYGIRIQQNTGTQGKVWCLAGILCST
jgi:hypothetical protein